MTDFSQDSVPPVFRFAFSDADGKATVPGLSGVSIETGRSGGERQRFAFVAKEGFLESTTAIPETSRLRTKRRMP